jgi:hypothetical protein
LRAARRQRVERRHIVLAEQPADGVRRRVARARASITTTSNRIRPRVSSVVGPCCRPRRAI